MSKFRDGTIYPVAGTAARGYASSYVGIVLLTGLVFVALTLVGWSEVSPVVAAFAAMAAVVVLWHAVCTARLLATRGELEIADDFIEIRTPMLREPITLEKADVFAAWVDPRWPRSHITYASEDVCSLYSGYVPGTRYNVAPQRHVQLSGVPLPIRMIGYVWTIGIGARYLPRQGATIFCFSLRVDCPPETLPTLGMPDEMWRRVS